MEDRLVYAPDFGRYSTALRRRWPFIVAVGAVLAALAGMSANGESSYTARFLISDFGQVAGELGYLAPKKTLTEQAEFLGADDTRNKLAERLNGTSVTVGVDPKTSSIQLSAEGSEEDVVAAFTVYVDELILYRQQAVESSAAVPLAVGKTQIEKLTETIRLLDEDLKSKAGDAEFLVIAGLQRPEQIRQRLAVEQYTALLEAAPDAASNDVQPAGFNRNNPNVAVRAVLAGLGGLVLASLVVAAFAHFDRKIRRSQQITDTLGNDSVFVDLSQDRGGLVSELLAAKVELERARFNAPVVFVGTSAASPQRLRDMLVPLLPGQSVDDLVVPPVTLADLPRVESSASAAVLVIETNSIDETDLVTAASVVTSRGHRLAGVALLAKSNG